MKRNMAITEFCKLTELVGCMVFKNKKAYDCLCNDRRGMHQQTHEDIITYIREAVEARMESEGLL